MGTSFQCRTEVTKKLTAGHTAHNFHIGHKSGASEGTSQTTTRSNGRLPWSGGVFGDSFVHAQGTPNNASGSTERIGHEDRRIGHVLIVSLPVPIRECHTGVADDLKLSFKMPNVPSMPGQEGTRSMGGGTISIVQSSKFIVDTTCFQSRNGSEKLILLCASKITP
jgi:hypothetical protein